MGDWTNSDAILPVLGFYRLRGSPGWNPCDLLIDARKSATFHWWTYWAGVYGWKLWKVG